MLFFFTCPNCGNMVKADSTLGGDMAECPHCDSRLMIPMDAVGPGTIVGGFHLMRKLGTGGMGDVYLAEQPSLARKVALKVLPPAVTRKENFVARFEQEVRMHGALNHPNIATAFDAGNDRDIYYLAMEYVDGTDLASYIDDHKTMPESMALSVIAEVAEGLKYGWDKKTIIHCDIKPGNIMMTKEGEVKVLDLGLSKSLAEISDLTQTGYMVGTPLYMSPEQADGSAEMDFRTDIYSLGSTLYHLVTGKPPFTGKTISEVIGKRATTEARPARQINTDLSPACERLLERMLARDPAQRFSSYDELLRGIAAVKEGRKPAPPGTRPSTGLPRGVWIGAGVALFAVASVIMVKGRKPDVPPAIPPLPLAAGIEAEIKSAYELAKNETSKQPDRLDSHILAFEAVKSGASKAGISRYVVLAEQEINALKERREREVNLLLSTLAREAQEKMAEQDFAGAIDAIENYTGPFMIESQKRREELLSSVRIEVESLKKKAIEGYLTELKKEVDRLVGEEDYLAAIRLLENAKGPLAALTKGQRTALAQQLQQQHRSMRVKEQAEQALRSSIYGNLKPHVDDGHFLDALALLRALLESHGQAALPLREELAGLEEDLLAVLSAEWRIIQSFKKEIDQTVHVDLTSGMVPIRIDQVGKSWFEGMENRDGATLRRYTVEDLSASEKLKRITRYETTSAALVQGGYLLSTGDREAALEMLRASERPLAKLIRNPAP